MQKANMGARFGALLLDGIFINVACLVVLYISWDLFWLVYPFATFLYYGICEGSSMSATLGKKICQIVVVDEYGNKLTGGQGFLRSLCRAVSSITLGIGFIMALFDEQGRGLHDKMAKTFVVTAVPALSGNRHTPVIPYGQPPAAAQVQSYRGNMGENPQIIGISGQFAGKSIVVTQQGIIFGRDAASCEFVFPESTGGISRNHCRIQYNPQTKMFVLYDLGSTYGTFLGSGAKVPQGQPAALRPGEEFYLASRDNLFRVSL